ncbi:hypothetical protein HPDP_00314 [Candidatus Hepatincola sp. Pdp]
MKLHPIMNKSPYSKLQKKTYFLRVYAHLFFISIPCFLLAFYVLKKYPVSQDAYFLILSMVSTIESAFFMLSITLGGILIVLPNNALIKFLKKRKLFHNFFQYLQILVVLSITIIALCIFNSFIAKQTLYFLILIGLTFSHLVITLTLSLLTMKLLSGSHL